MSYDLHVYAANALTGEALSSLLIGAGLDVDSRDPGSDSWTVVSGARRAYSFTLGLPVAVEPEDVPEEVTAILLDARFMYELLVEGSSPTETPHAVKFARSLADAAGGAVLDEQTGETWTRGKLRAVERVERGLVAVVNIRWYVRGDADPAEAAVAWTTAARRQLPEALPRRYGTYEPLQHKFDEGGDAAFADFSGAADGTVYFKATQPTVEGSLAAGPSQIWHVRSHSLTVLRPALDDARWRIALRRLFVDFAARTSPVLATAEVVRDLDWSGRGLAYNERTERSTYLAARGNWAGLPPYPIWLTWFGAEYLPLVASYLRADQVEMHGDALFHWRSDAPADRDQLLAAVAADAGKAKRRLFRRASREPAGRGCQPNDCPSRTTATRACTTHR